MITLAVKIGEVYSMLAPENESIKLDDRQTRIETMNGVVVQDFGYHPEGNITEWTLQFWQDDWQIILDYASNREFVEIRDGDDVFWARIIIKSYEKIKWFRNLAVKVKVELWRV